MPEGDSIYRIACRIGAALNGRTITVARAHESGPVLHVAGLIGALCEGVEIHGKNLFIHFEKGLVLRGRLRMYGVWRVLRSGEPLPFPEWEVRLVLETATSTVVNLRGPVLELWEHRALPFHERVAKLGPDGTTAAPQRA